MKEHGKREIWVDNVKIFACLLVVMGHLFQSLVKAGILQENDLYLWFNQTIYTFHVPLFFICSGYLHQRGRIDSISRWGRNVLKKLLSLGIPYITFSTITWVFKTLLSSSVNSEIGPLAQTLLLSPESPYWYLYTLFFLFLVTPTFENSSIAALWTVLAVLCKMISLFSGPLSINIPVFAVSSVFTYEIWFIFGMWLQRLDFRKRVSSLPETVTTMAGVSLGMLFLVSSVVIYSAGLQSDCAWFLLGLCGCAAAVLTAASVYRDDHQNRFCGFMSGYTFPVFVMHTLFAAALRILLVRVGILSPLVHICAGTFISCAGPILAAYIMEHLWHLDFLLYPGRYIKIS